MTEFMQGKVIVITGAASGFGMLVSQKAAAMGAKIVAADINQVQLNEVVVGVQSNNGQISGLETDVTNREQVEALAKHAINTFGAIDVMINNAGIMPLAFFADHAQAKDAWERCIDINFKGVLNGISSVYDQMMLQGRGHVINLSSIYGNFPVAGGGVYGATKAAVDFLSESLRQETQGKIKVTNVKPTGIPATGLGAGVINPMAVSGILGGNAAAYMERFAQAAEGKVPPELTDPEKIGYYALDPEYLADQIIYAINQPWGVSISEITVRASGDAYVI
ncbi:MAG: NADP-dependent 3-hydroxy acid dehydrogenase YdfG [Patiriisocius sp.]|jgi:NADP-dependent 3-hydroxy acid dehydrogenase YdfG